MQRLQATVVYGRRQVYTKQRRSRSFPKTHNAVQAQPVTTKHPRQATSYMHALSRHTHCTQRICSDCKPQLTVDDKSMQSRDVAFSTHKAVQLDTNIWQQRKEFKHETLVQDTKKLPYRFGVLGATGTSWFWLEEHKWGTHRFAAFPQSSIRKTALHRV